MFKAQKPHRVMIVGGGVAGLELANRLSGHAGAALNVSLIDKRRTHLWKPLIHSVAAGSVDPSAHEVDYLAQAHWRGFTYHMGELIGLDRSAKQVCLAPAFDEDGREITPRRTIGYDVLVIAIGSISNDFGTPGAAQYAVPLDTTDQATRFNHRLVNACIRAETQKESIRPGQLHVAIIGAGATGTELAAELHKTINQIVSYGFTRIHPQRDLRIILIEAADRILPGLPPRISKAAAALLRGLDVDIKTSARVKEVRPEGLQMANGEFLPAELIVWAAGVKGPDFLRDLDGLEVSRANQLVVLQTLQTTRDPDIFAIGDCADCPQPGAPQPVPPRAQAAQQQASHMVGQIRRLLAKEPLRPYVYKDFGSLVSLSDYGAAGNLMGFLSGRGLFVEGFIARIMYRMLYLRHQIAVHGFWRALFVSLGRSLSRRAAPMVKLH